MADQPRGLGRRVTQAREQRGLNQNELALQARVRRDYISRIESGERANPTWEIMLRIAEVLEVSLDWLAERERTSQLLPTGTTLMQLAIVPAV